MDLKEAKEALKPPLIFGSDRQIKAHQWLEQFELAKEAARACDSNHEVLQNRVPVIACDCCDEFSEEIRHALDMFFEDYG